VTAVWGTALATAGLVLAVPGATFAQEAGSPPGDLLLLAATRTATMSQEVDDAARRGYRVLSAAGGVDFNEVIVVLQPGNPGYQYQLVSTDRTSTFEAEVNTAAREGYRVMPRTVTIKRSASLFNSNDYELFVLLEKTPEAAPPVQYQLLATSRTGTLQQELAQAAMNGWRLVTVLVRGEVLALMERPAP